MGSASRSFLSCPYPANTRTPRATSTVTRAPMDSKRNPSSVFDGTGRPLSMSSVIERASIERPRW